MCLKWSRNEYAETMLRSLAPATGEATADAGLEVVRDTLSKWGVAPELYVARDGSGLSRNDYLSPDVLIAVLTAIWRDPRHVDAFRSALPVAGVSGTLANQLKDTPASGRVWAKTGSMSNVRSLSGYLMTLDDEPIVFTFMATGFHVPASADRRRDEPSAAAPGPIPARLARGVESSRGVSPRSQRIVSDDVCRGGAH